MGIKTHYQPQGKKLKWMSSVPSSPKAMSVAHTRLHSKPTFQLSISSNSGREEEFAFSHEESKILSTHFLREGHLGTWKSLCYIISEYKKQQGISEVSRASLRMTGPMMPFCRWENWGQRKQMSRLHLGLAKTDVQLRNSCWETELIARSSVSVPASSGPHWSGGRC